MRPASESDSDVSTRAWEVLSSPPSSSGSDSPCGWIAVSYQEPGVGTTLTAWLRATAQLCRALFWLWTFSLIVQDPPLIITEPEGADTCLEAEMPATAWTKR